MTTTDKPYGWSPDMHVPLLEKLKADLKTSMLQKNETLRNAIRQIMSEFPKLTVPLTLESGKKSFRLKTAEEITNDDILDIIRGLVKSEKTVISLKPEQSPEYLHILEAYLPKMASEEDIRSWIEENVDFSKFKSPTQAMGAIMKHFGKQADGNLVKRILDERKR